MNETKTKQKEHKHGSQKNKVKVQALYLKWLKNLKMMDLGLFFASLHQEVDSSTRFTKSNR